MANFKIRDFRRANNIFQDELATVIGLTQSNLSRYETNGVDLTDEMIEKMRERYGNEKVDPFFTDSAEQARQNEVPAKTVESMTTLDLVTIVKKQNDTICKQIEVQNEFTRQVTSINERLLNLLEKVQFE